MPGDEALEHLRAGRPRAAAELLALELEHQPNDARRWFLLGASRHALKELDAAVEAFARSVQLRPGDPQAHLALVSVLRDAGNLEDALKAAAAALEALPNESRLHYAMALAAEELGETSRALTHYDAALQLDPGLDDALHNRGLLLLRTGRIAEALGNHRSYCRLYPASARAFSVLADALLAAGQFDQALRALDTYQRLLPADSSGLIRRGVALAGQRLYDQARSIFALAHSNDPEGVVRFIARIAPQSDLRFMLSPENLFLWQGWLALGRCDWSWWSTFVSEMRRLAEPSAAVVEPAATFMSFHLPLSGPERHAVARRVASDLESHIPRDPPRPAQRGGSIRIGILSPDLREHLNAYLLLPLFELLDRSRFALKTYSVTGSDGSGIRKRIDQCLPGIRDLSGLSDDAAAAVIRDDDIDILLDIGGHTTGARFGITARRPARVQASYLAFAGSLGSSRIDFAITDRIAGGDPAEWTEERIFLPHTYYLYDFRDPAPDLGLKRSDYGLPESHFVYCAFHKAEKISPDSFALWMQILKRVPDAVLWMLSLQPIAQENLRREATRLGADPRRLIFAPFDTRERYLARHRLGDLMLDAIHHSAMTTACDAMAAGLPVLTLRGEAMASRTGESLARAAALPELVALSQEEFVEKAVRLAQEPSRRAEYRDVLIQRKGPLFDTAGRVRELEAALQEMWDRHLAGARPA